MTAKEPVTPDMMDSLIPAPALDQEIAKLGAWLLSQDAPALKDLPVSALGALAEYVKGRVHADRCERFVQASREERNRVEQAYPPPMPLDSEEDEIRLSESRPTVLPIPVGGLSQMWEQAEPPQTPEFNIPRPGVAQ